MLRKDVFRPLIRSILFLYSYYSLPAWSLIQRLCHDPPGYVEGLLEYGQIQVFAGGMDVEHTGGDPGAVKAVAGEDIAVAGAVADMVFRCDPFQLQGADRCLCKEAVQIRLVGRAEVVHIDVHGGSEFGGRFLACIHDLLYLGLDLGLGVRADLARIHI